MAEKHRRAEKDGGRSTDVNYNGPSLPLSSSLPLHTTHTTAPCTHMYCQTKILTPFLIYRSSSVLRPSSAAFWRGGQAPRTAQPAAARQVPMCGRRTRGKMAKERAARKRASTPRRASVARRRARALLPRALPLPLPAPAAASPVRATRCLGPSPTEGRYPGSRRTTT